MEAEAMAATKAAEVKLWTTVVGWASRRAVARGMGQRRGRRQVERVERKSATLGALVLPAAAAFREHVEAVTFFCRCIPQQTEASDIRPKRVISYAWRLISDGVMRPTHGMISELCYQSPWYDITRMMTVCQSTDIIPMISRVSA